MKKKIKKRWSAVMLCALLLGISNANCAFADTSVQFAGGLTEFRQAVTNPSTNVEFDQLQDITNTDASDTSLSNFGSTNFILKGTDTNTIDLGNPTTGILNVGTGRTANVNNVGSVTNHTGGFKNVAINNKGGNLNISDTVFNDSSSVVTNGGTTNLNNIYMTGTSQVLYQNDALSSTITNTVFSGTTGNTVTVASGCSADLTIDHTIFLNNGDLDINFKDIISAGNLDIKNSTFTGNNNGSSSVIDTSGDLSISNSTFTSNTGGPNGVINSTGKLNITDSSFSTNSGGGSAVINAGNDITINNSDFENNNGSGSPNGLIYATSGNIGITNSIFKGNTGGGGAVINAINDITVSNSDFENNTNSLYGVIYSSTGTINVTNSIFKSNQGSIASNIYNSGDITVSNSNFENNTGGEYGVMHSDNGTVNIKNSYFKNNSSGDKEIAGKFVDVDNSQFIENTSGYLFISSDDDMHISNSEFLNNHASYYSMINAGNNINISNSEFLNNNASYGILIGKDIDISNSTISNNSANFIATGNNIDVSNSIISNNNTTDNVFYGTGEHIKLSDSIVSNNMANDSIFYGTNININNSFVNNNIASNSIFYGTNIDSTNSFVNNNIASNSIFNGTNIDITNSIVNNNTASNFIFGGTNIDITNSQISNNIGHYCIAISSSNNGYINFKNSLFENNIVNSSNNTSAAAILTKNLNSINTSYINNSTTLSDPNIEAEGGGAIILNKDSTANIIADNGNSLFHGNTVNGQSNAINLTGTNNTVNLNAGNGGVVQFDDKITSSGFTNKININKSIQDSHGNNIVNNGQVILNNSVTNSSVNMYNGTLSLGNENVLNGDNLALNGGYLNLINNQTGTMSLNNLAINGNTNLGIDVDLANQTADKITSATPVTGTGKINITRLNAFGVPTSANMNIAVADANARSYTTFSGASHLETPIYNYNIDYDATSGNMNFTNAGFNNSANAPVVGSVVGNYLSQVNMVNEVFGHLDSLMFLSKADRLELKYKNRTASADGQFVFSPTLLPQENPAIWVKQFTTFENVPLKNGPNVSNVAYGMLAGADSPYKEFKNGYVGYLTAYMGYTGSHQNYDDVGVYQNGGLVGLTGTVYKGNFFTSLTFNVGASAGNNYTDFGIDNFSSLNANTAIKTGYNFEFFDGKMILQPSVMVAYSFMKTFDYTTAGGVSMTSSPVNYLQVAPGVKIIGNLKNGWQPYIGVDVVINTMNSGTFYANNVQLPLCSVDPYVQYGVGLQKQWGKRMTGFGQVMARGGGRNGVALQFGFRWAFGKE